MSPIYFKELSSSNTLKSDELATLFERYQKGDSKALEIIIKANLKLVVHFARHYENAISEHDIIEIDDLISEGNIGLLNAVEKYNPSLGVNFPYYARIWIKKQITTFLINHFNTIKIPWHKAKKNASIERKIKELEQSLVREVEQEDILKLGIYSDAELQSYYSKPVMVNLEDEPLSQEVTIDLTSERLEMINHFLPVLPTLQQKVIREYFGVDCEPKKLVQIAEELGVTKQRVYYLKQQGIKTIQSFIK